MCGIAGVFHRGGRPVDPARLARFNRIQAHRGPDDQGIWREEGVGFAHRRLSILDLSERGRQPMDLGPVVGCYNGEIFNYRELKGQLEGLGHTFRSDTDTEVLLRSWLEWGEGCVSRFNGMWAFALWDRARRRLFASRDRFGVKPFYYVDRGGELVFASEPKALLADDPSLRRLRPETLVRFLAEGLVDDEASTFYQEVQRLPPAHCLVADEQGLRIWRYWDLEGDPDLEAALALGREHLQGVPGWEALERTPRAFEPADPAGVFESPVTPGMDRAAEALRALLVDAVRLRLRSDVPVGTCLSGGLDSGTLVSLASRLRSDPMDTFSSIYPQADCDESRFIRAIVASCGARPHEVTPTPAELPERLARIMWHQDEPSAAPGIYSQWKVMEAAQGHVKVLLDGQGGDELLAGYHSYFPEHLSSLAARVVGGAWAEEELWREVERIRTHTGRSLEEEARRALRRARKPRWLARLSEGQPGPIKPPRWVHPELARQGGGRRGWLGPRSAPPRTPPARLYPDRLSQRLYNDLTMHSIPSLLRYEDRNSMAFHLEARTPLLDYRLVEFCFRLPSEFKISGAETKAVLRRAMAGWMPREVVERKDKLGYPTPVAHWFRGELRGWVEGVFRDPRFTARGFFVPAEVERVMRRHLEGEDRSWDLWRFLATEFWARQLLDGEGFEASAVEPAR